MRFELRLILWVTAASVAAAAVFVGTADTGPLSLPTQNNTIGAKTDSHPEFIGSYRAETGVLNKTLPETSKLYRNLFPVEPAPLVAIAEPGLEEELPGLTGIFSSSGVLSAILRIDGGYALVQPGAEIGAFLVVEITPDAVVLRRQEDEEAKTILLRGAGELP